MSIRVNYDVCQICGKSTSWDDSFGPENFIICHDCFDRISKKYTNEAYNIVLLLSTIRSDNRIESEEKYADYCDSLENGIIEEV